MFPFVVRQGYRKIDEFGRGLYCNFGVAFAKYRLHWHVFQYPERLLPNSFTYAIVCVMMSNVGLSHGK